MMLFKKIVIGFLFFLILSIDCTAYAENSLVLGKIFIKSSSGNSILNNAKVELLEVSSGNTAGKAIYNTYTNSQGIFGFFDIPYGNYALRVSFGNIILPQQYIDNEGSEKRANVRLIIVNRERIKMSEIIVSRSGVPMDFGDDHYSMKAKHSGQCLDVKGKSTSEKANVQQWPCNGEDNQLWKIE